MAHYHKIQMLEIKIRKIKIVHCGYMGKGMHNMRFKREK